MPLQAIRARVLLTAIALVVVGAAARASADAGQKRWLQYKTLKGTIRIHDGTESASLGELWKEKQRKFSLDAKFEVRQVSHDEYFGRIEYKGRLVGKVAYAAAIQGITTEHLESEVGAACVAAIGPDSEMTLSVSYAEGTYGFMIAAPARCSENKLKVKASGAKPVEVEAEELFVTASPTPEQLLKGFPLPPAGKAFTDSSAMIVVPNAILTLPFEGRATWWVEMAPSDVSMSACELLAVDQHGKLTATGEPPGGTCAFSVAPPSVARVQSQGCTATITATSPGTATVSVDYTSKGTTSRASQELIALRVDSINEGQPVPRIAIYDRDLQRKPSESTVLTVPVAAQERGAASLLGYALSNPAVLTVRAQPDSALLQALRIGTTTLQARTSCGGPTGPIVDVEVVRCDDETMKMLNEQMQIAKDAARQANRDYHAATDSAEFQKAASRIASSTANLAFKTAGLLAGVMGAAGTAAASTAADLYGAADAIRDAALKGDFAGPSAQVTLQGFKNGIVGNTAGAVGVLWDAYETKGAADEFGQDLGALLSANIKLEEAASRQANYLRIIEEITAKIVRCTKGGDEAPKPDDPQPRPTPTPGPKPPSKEPQPQGGSTPSADPTPQDPGSEPPWQPPPPQPGPGPMVVGLPILPGEIGCTTPPEVSAIAIPTRAPADVSHGLRNLNGRVTEFVAGPLAALQRTLDEWKSLVDRMEAAIAVVPVAQGRGGAEAFVPELDGLLARTKAFGDAGSTFAKEFDSCPTAVKTGLAALEKGPELNLGSSR